MVRKKRGRALRLLRVAALLFALGLPALYFTRERVLGPLLVRLLTARVEAQLGARLVVGRVGGDWLHTLELEGVSWESEHLPLRGIRDASVHATYSLGALLRGGLPRVERLVVRADGLQLDLGALGPRSTDSDPSDPDAASSMPLVESFELELRNVELRGLPPAPATAAVNSMLVIEELTARGELRDEHLGLDGLTAIAGTNALRLDSFHVDLGEPDLVALLRRAAGDVSLEIGAPEELLRGTAFPEDFRAQVRASLRAGSASLSGSITVGGGEFELRRGGLTLPPDAATLSEAEIDLDLSFACPELGWLGALSAQPLAGELSGELALRGSLHDPRGKLSARSAGLVLGDLVFDDLRVELDADGESVQIRELNARGPGLTAEVTGALRLAPLTFEDTSLELVLPRLRAFDPALPDARDLNLVANLRGPLDDLQGELSLECGSILLPRQAIQSLSLRGAFDPHSVTLAHLSVITDVGSCAGDGVLRPASGRRWAEIDTATEVFELQLNRLSAESDVTQVAAPDAPRNAMVVWLAQPATILLGAAGVRAEELRLESELGQAFLRLHQDAGGLGFGLEVDAFDPQPLLAPFLAPGWRLGTLDGRLEGELSNGETRFDVQLAITGLRLGEERPAWDVSVLGEMVADRVTLQSFFGEAEDGARLRGTAEFPLRLTEGLEFLPGEVALDLSVEELDVARHLSGMSVAGGRLSVNAQFAGPWDHLKGRLGVEVSDYTTSDLSLAKRVGPQALSLELSAGDQLELTRCALAGEGTQLALTGVFDTHLDVPRWVERPRELADVPLTLTADGSLADLAFLSGLTDALRRVEGRVDGSLSVTGTPGAPVWDAGLRLHAGRLRISPELPILSAIEAELVCTNERMTIRALGAELGGAPCQLSGSIGLGGEEPEFALAFSGQEVLLARSSSLRLRADVELALEGPLSALRIGGDLALTDGRYARNVDFLRSYLQGGEAESSARPSLAFSLAREAPLANAQLDIDITSVNPFRIDTNLAELSLRPELHVGGTGEVPLMEGSIFVGASRLSLPSGTLRIRTGRIEFLRQDPFDPRINVTGDMVAQGYRIQATLGGKSTEPEILLSADPPLASDELMVLFLTGRRPEGKGNEALESVAIYLANDFLSSWLFAKDPDAVEGLADRFSYESGGALSRNGSPTGRATFLLRGERLERGRSEYLVAEFDRYDQVNFGFGILFRFR